MKEKIGVYICHCGGNIADYVDVKKVREIVEKEEGVALAKDMMFTCADSAQKQIMNDIKDQRLDAIVVASCSPKLHLYTFRNVAERAGLNQYNYVQANVREQCSWTHTDKPKEATEKAIRIIRAAINRARHSEALAQITIPATNAVLVIGAGMAGMRAALDLADMGTEVVLIEKDHFVGGRTAQMGTLFLTDERGEDVVEKLYNEIKKREKIKLFTGAELESMSGCIGNFKTTVKVNPRYVAVNADKNRLNEAVTESPGEVPDKFNFGLTQRKSVYKPYEKALPDIPAVDKELLMENPKFINKYKDCIDPDQETETLNFEVGGVILSTGFDPYEPEDGEYGYKKAGNVITLQQLKRLIEVSNNKLEYNNKEIKNVVFIYCIGTRQVEGENKYCARFCCTAAVHTSLLLRKNFFGIRNFHLYRDMRTYGRQELLFDEASRLGDLFFKFDADDPPVVEEKNGNALVKFKDLLTDNEEMEIEPDLVVLVTGMVPREDSEIIGGILKVPIGTDKFFNEVHPKLRPVETVIAGTYICGACQGPKNISESIASALSAAAKANATLGSGKIELEPNIIRIDPELCEWCGKCLEICPYDCIMEADYTAGDGKNKKIAEVNKATCKGCGMCSPVCPYNAIDIIGFTDNEIESMIDGLLKEV
jgi:heterodisulfide reductase subunit A